MTQGDVYFIDKFEDGTFDSKWEDIDGKRASEAQVTESDGLLSHAVGFNYGPNSPLQTTQTFDATGTLRLEMQVRTTDPNYWGYGVGVYGDNHRVVLKEHKWEGFNRFAVFGVTGHPDKYNSDYRAYGDQPNKAKLADATSDTSFLTYSITVDLDEQTVTEVRRGDETWNLDLGIKDLGDSYRLRIPNGGGHDVEYDAIAVGPADGDWSLTDSSTTVTPTPSPTKTQTPTPTPALTPTASYDLRAAIQQTEVQPYDRTLLVLRDIPNAGRRYAVTTPEYDLVGTDRARSALMTYTWGQRAFAFDWEAEYEYARDVRSQFKRTESLNRFAELGWDLLAANALATVATPLALGPTIELYKDALTWTVGEIEDPYMETMSKMGQWTYSDAELNRDLEQSRDLVDLTGTAADAVAVGYGIAGAAENWRTAIRAAQSAYAASSNFTLSLKAGLAASAPVLVAAAAGELAGRGLEQVTTGMHANAKLAAIGHSYHTFRIPIINKILSLRNRAINFRLSPEDAINLTWYTANHHYSGAFANAGMANIASDLSDSFAGVFWDALAEVGTTADELRKLSEQYQQAGAARHYQLGVDLREAGNRAAESINAEVDGEPTDILAEETI